MAEGADQDRAAWEGELFRLLAENVQDYAIFVVDPQRRVLCWTAASERLLGYSEEEILGQSADCIFTPEDIAAGAPEQEVAGALEMGRGDDDRWHVRKDGSRFWSSGVMTPLWQDDGKLRGFAKIMRDRTDWKLADEARIASEQRFERFTQHLPGLAWIKDLQGRYVYVNDAAERAFRTPREQLYGRTDAEIFPPETAAQFQENDAQALAHKSGVQVIETLEHDDGQVHYSLVSKFPIPDHQGRPALVGGMAIDITDRMHAEQEVARLLESERQHTLQLREADRRKDEFLAMLAHELRNPLAPIRSGLDVLDLSGVGHEVLGIMREQVAHLVRLVDDLLDVSRISRGKVHLRREPTDLCKVIHHAAGAMRPMIEAARHTLDVSLPPSPVWVEADPVRLGQVVTNLLSNSAKYTDPGGRIWLSLRREGEQAVVSVRDDGIGISAELLPFVFDLCRQADSSPERAQGGLGIGLTVVKGLVEMHGGSVVAHSAGEGRGSEFLVRLPMLSEADTPNTAAAPATAIVGRRVLVVDDNVAAAKMLALLLETLGEHQVRVVHDGLAAIEAAATFCPEVVLLDIGLPRMSGYEVARRLQESSGFAGVLLAALTGYGTEEDRRRSRAAGFDAHLVKPPSVESLQELFAHPKLERCAE